MGNLGSVKRKLDKAGFPSMISDKPRELNNADKLILPGVGHFSKAVQELEKRDLWDFLNDAVLIRRTPILGICLGMQLMSEYSEEGGASGFGWIKGRVSRFKVKDSLKHKIPHIGWNTVTPKKDSILCSKIIHSDEFYFVHSFHMECNHNDDILFTSVYDYEFIAGVQKDNIFGVQFHPEKSHDAGRQMLNNFINKA